MFSRPSSPAAVLVAASLIVAAIIGTARAAAAFSNTTISGNYALGLSISGCTNNSKAVGRLGFNGLGKIVSTSSMTVYDTNSGSPTVTQFNVSGTYSVSRNGSGTIQLQNATTGETSNFRFVLDDVSSTTFVAKRVELLQTDLRSDNCIGAGSLARQ